MSDEKAEILVRLNEGRTVPTFPCDCGSCGNEWFVPGYSDEWMPSFCPYCGIKFIRKTVGDDERPDKYKPKACPAPLAWSSERLEELARRVLWPVRWRIEGDENADYIIKSVVEILREELNPPQAGPSPDPMEAR